ncbi:hypothetical protein AAFN47_06045 [Hoeflea sp. CAU 1731]
MRERGKWALADQGVAAGGLRSFFSLRAADAALLDCGSSPQ